MMRMADIKIMNQEEMQVFYSRLSELTKQGSEREVREYINDHYLHLPEEIRDEVLFNLMRSSIDEQSLEDRTIETIQNEGATAVETLEEIKKEVEKEQAA
jgi:hypothetical protein